MKIVLSNTKNITLDFLLKTIRNNLYTPISTMNYLLCTIVIGNNIYRTNKSFIFNPLDFYSTEKLGF